jgi:hypothetical protein
MSPNVRAILCGMVAAVACAFVWGGIAYAIHKEIGWLAIGLGFVVGFAVRLGAGESDGVVFGIIAVLLACIALLLGKFFAVRFIVNSEIQKITETQITDKEMIDDIADDVADEWRSKNRKVEAPDNRSALTKKLDKGNNYLPAVNDEAARRWNAFTPAEKASKIQEQKANRDAFIKTMTSEARKQAFTNAFSLFDIIFFVFAAVTAFGVGAGIQGED